MSAELRWKVLDGENLAKAHTKIYVHTHRIFKVPMPKSQSGFIKALVLPLFEKVDQVGPRLACFLAAPHAHNPLCNPNVQHHILDICKSRIGAVRYPVCAGGGRA